MSKRSKSTQNNTRKKAKINHQKLEIRSDRYYRAVDKLNHFFGEKSIINVSTPFLLSPEVKKELKDNGVTNISPEPFFESNRNFLVELKVVKLQPCRLGPYSGKAEFVLAEKFCEITKIWYDENITYDKVKEMYNILEKKYKTSSFEKINIQSINLKSKESWDSIKIVKPNPKILSDYMGFGFDAIIIPTEGEYVGHDIWLAEQLFGCFNSNINPKIKYIELLRELDEE
ncbi:hypothetical protein CPAV1605_1464 [seawater metagenome]|uniref:Uncharacterized protein n=1 Tax=seawater metagenome TaxID=1561972 RepID=A0A5E8CLC6_9ZZZZ